MRCLRGLFFAVILRTEAETDGKRNSLSKWGCVFSMVIWPAFRLGQYRVNDHPYYAPQFSVMDPSLEQIN